MDTINSQFLKYLPYAPPIDIKPVISKNDEIKQESPVIIQQTHSGILNQINRLFWTSLGAWTAYNLIDSGLSRFLGLETLTHGTGPLGYIGINLNGADPNFGGGKTGSSVMTEREDFVNNSKNFFHVFKDSEFPLDCMLPFMGVSSTCIIGNTLLPKIHSVKSGVANFGYNKNEISHLNSLKDIFGSIAGFLTPTLKFRFTPEEVFDPYGPHGFEDDPDYLMQAYRTAKPIKASHLGITGSLTQGINGGMFSRMIAHPGKVLIGATLLGLGTLVAIKTYRYVKNSAPHQIRVSEKNLSFFQKNKKRIKKLAAGSCLITVAFTTIILNTF